MKNKELFANIVSDNRDKIVLYCKHLLKRSFTEPCNFSGWNYRVVIDIDGELDYLLGSNNSFSGEIEGTMLCVAKFPADYGNDIDLGSVHENMTTEEYNDYADWYCKTYGCEIETIDDIYKELNDWEEVQTYKPELYAKVLEIYIRNEVECMLEYKIHSELDEIIEYLEEF